MSDQAADLFRLPGGTPGNPLFRAGNRQMVTGYYLARARGLTRAGADDDH